MVPSQAPAQMQSSGQNLHSSCLETTKNTRTQKSQQVDISALCVCVCVFLYLLDAEYQNLLSTIKVRTFGGRLKLQSCD